MAVIKDYISPTGCHIIVHDDYIQPPQEVEKIIQRVSDLVYQAAYAREMRRRMEENK